ncbi:hypothetical protein FPSE_00258 [Fusarium pseudograminearum CS3096]|uniref:Uncharacterized protein n=1 Tax=Fusarium pseudograminearum (strain CS3096) TaxID=1028729 RepID=K3VWM2_FUSPC|nr:hypothetical protein FPSE_00258 [Fusarium pseudograminearum CS3096]EKJ79573.1 hypothetical protein FPSE_00258 [Fusarium pseudograminearum CS3096]
MLAPQPDYVAFHPSERKNQRRLFHDNSKFLNCIRSGDGEHCEFLRAAQQKATTTTCACVMANGQGGPNRVGLINVYEEAIIAERLKVEKRKDAIDDSEAIIRVYDSTRTILAEDPTFDDIKDMWVSLIPNKRHQQATSWYQCQASTVTIHDKDLRCIGHCNPPCISTKFSSRPPSALSAPVARSPDIASTQDTQQQIT